MSENFFDKLDSHESSESYDSSSCSHSVDVDPKVLDFGAGFRPLANPPQVLYQKKIELNGLEKEPKEKISIEPKSAGPLIGNREFAKVEKKAHLESEASISSIDSKPSVRGPVKKEFSFPIAQNQPRFPIPVMKKLPSMKYEHNNDPSISSSSFSSESSSVYESTSKVSEKDLGKIVNEGESFKGNWKMLGLDGNIIDVQEDSHEKKNGLDGKNMDVHVKKVENSDFYEKKVELDETVKKNQGKNETKISIPGNAIEQNVEVPEKPVAIQIQHIQSEIKIPNLKIPISPIEEKLAVKLDQSSSFSHSKDDFSEDLFIKEEVKKPESGQIKKVQIKVPVSSDFPEEELEIIVSKNFSESSDSKFQKEFKNMDLDLGESYKYSQKLLFNAKLLTFSQVVAGVKSRPFVNERLWRKKNCWNPICGCLKKTEELPQTTEQNLLKLLALGSIPFDNNEQFHKDLLMSLYSRFYGRNEFLNNSKVWKELGFSSEDVKKNEITKPGILLAIIHLLFMYETCPGIMYQFTNTSFSNKPFLLIQTAIRLIGISIDLLKRQLLNHIVTRDNGDGIQTFMQFHTGLIVLWVEIYLKAATFDESYRVMQEKARKNPELILEIYNKNGSS